MSMSEADLDVADRMCIVTREVLDEAELVRFVRAPDGLAVFDPARKLPGRGVWVKLSRKAVETAATRNLFARGFKAETRVPPDLAGLTHGKLQERALGYLALAKKAGEVVAGQAKVEEALARGQVRLLIHASDAAPGGREKLDRRAGEDVGKINSLTGVQLDLALGRANVVHAAVKSGGLAEKLLSAARRAETFWAG